MKVLLTGAAAHLARPLLPRLLALPEIEQVTGIDLRPSGFTHPRYQEHHLDILDPAAQTLAAEHDALIHLAFVVMRSRLGARARDREWMRRINVHGSLSLFQAAASAAVPRVIHLSSASVYGAWPDNPPRLDENTPLRGIPGFAYAEDKITVERGLTQLAERHPTTRFIVFRPHVILGRHAQPYLKRLLTAPVSARLPDPPPKIQCVWEDDVARAVCLALQHPVRGPFNLATDPPVTLAELRHALGRRGLTLPLSWITTLHRLAWRLTPRAEDPAWLNGAAYSLILDCRRAHGELGWHPRLAPSACAREALQD